MVRTFLLSAILTAWIGSAAAAQWRAAEETPPLEAQASLGGVVLPGEGAMRERAVTIRPAGVFQATLPGQSAEGAFEAFLHQSLPEDDRGRFYVVAYVNRYDAMSKLLLRDFERNDSLRTLAQWGKFDVVDWSASPAQRARIERTDPAALPSVAIYPHPDHPVYPFQWAAVHDGYGGDAGLLARNLYTQLRSFLIKYNPAAAGQCPPWRPDCPTPTPRKPYQPNPYRPDDDYGPRPFPDTPELPAGPEEPTDRAPGVSIPAVLVLGVVMLVLLVLAGAAGAAAVVASKGAGTPRGS